MKWIKVQLAIALGLALLGSTVMNAQTNKDRPLDARQQTMISALKLVDIIGSNFVGVQTQSNSTPTTQTTTLFVSQRH